jgi:hypothetical protein
MTEETDTKHPCKQGPTLAVICEQLNGIEKSVEEIKTDQKALATAVTQAALNSAQYPSPQFVNKSIAKLDRHDLYFKVIWVALGCAWAVLLIVVSIMLNKLMA